MTTVWSYSKAKGSALLTLLAIADSANDDGVAWPGHRYLAAKTRLSRSSVQRLTMALEQDFGELEIQERDGTSNLYVVRVKEPSQGVPQVEAPSADRVPQDEAGGASQLRAGTVTEPSFSTTSDEVVPATPRRADHIWDVLVELYGHIPDTQKARAARGRIKSDLRQLATLDGMDDDVAIAAEIRRRAGALRAEWDGRDTARALVENWKLAGRVADGHGKRPEGLDADALLDLGDRLEEQGR